MIPLFQSKALRRPKRSERYPQINPLPVHIQPKIAQISPAVFAVSRISSILLTVEGVDHRAGPEEEQRLEEGVREQMKDPGSVSAKA